MWKKFLASAAIFAIAGANMVAFAAGAGVNNMTVVSPSTFNPSNGEVVQVTYDLVGSATTYNVLAYAYDTAGLLVPSLLVDSKNTGVGLIATKPNTGITYTWYGKDANNVVYPDGNYVVKIESYDTAGVLVDSDTKNVTINSDVVVVAAAPKVTDLTAEPVTFSPEGNENSEISFNVDKDAYVKVLIKNGPTTVKTFSQYDGTKWYASTESHSILWDGKNSNGNALADGVYTVYVSATNDSGVNTYTLPITVLTVADVSNGSISDLTLDPSKTWDPVKDGELVIDFELLSDAKYLSIEAKSGNKVIEILDDQGSDDGDYSEIWDGTDDDGDYVSAGVWTITVRADGSKVTQSVTVEYAQPSIKNTLITKTSFDPAQYEATTLLFKVDTSSVVTVEAYKGAKKQVTLVENETMKKNKWYAVSFFGYDEEGDEVDYGKDWKFKITAENPTEDKVLSTTWVEFDIEEDTASSKASNITADYAGPAALEKGYGRTFGYTLESDAEVYLAVYEGTTASGKAKAELLDYVDQTAGYNEVFWNGLDSDDKLLKDGLYSYKLISKATSGSSKDTETGIFAIGNTAYFGSEEPTPVDPEPTPVDPVDPTPIVPDTEANCGEYYSDMVDNSSELCEALTWVSENEIFGGYADGSFKPYKNINRAEVLKVVLNAFNVDLLPADGSKLGFKDVDSNAWYMTFARTAQFYGMLEGYNNGTEARLENNVTRVELLKFVLEASKQFTGYEWANGYYYPPVDYTKCDPYYGCGYADNSEASWFYEYANAAFSYELYNTQTVDGKVYLHPSQEVERGEVALLLYRMHKAGLSD
ncbi:S-layer homology domain-containing protein [Candidatus Gracilibacteria bacterium]|nr:S-layer homology domain-containing protein [Candidatus Gracilibacteria bacterium]